MIYGSRQSAPSSLGWLVGQAIVMFRILVLLAAFTAGCTAVAAWVVSIPRPAFAEADAPRFEGGDAARASRFSTRAMRVLPCLTRSGGSAPPRRGLALGSPFGTFHPPNISPDPEDGIGHWRGIDLANALMAGVSPDGRHYYPSLPYASYAHMRAEDVRDLMAYLRTLPPVRGRAPPHQLPFPLTIRRGVGFWKLLYLDRTPVLDDPSLDATWNCGLSHRGALPLRRVPLHEGSAQRHQAVGPFRRRTGSGRGRALCRTSRPWRSAPVRGRAVHGADHGPDRGPADRRLVDGGCRQQHGRAAGRANCATSCPMSVACRRARRPGCRTREECSG